MGNRANALTYAYDSRSRLIQKTGHNPGGGGSAPVTTYTYNAASQPLSVTDPMGAVTQYVYASSGWLDKVISPDPDGSGPLFSPITQFGYDALGRQISQTDPLGRVSTQELDWRGNVLSAGGVGLQPAEYSYDDAGHLISTEDPLGGRKGVRNEWHCRALIVVFCAATIVTHGGREQLCFNCCRARH